MSKNFMQVSIGVFFITLSLLLVWGTIISKEAVDESIIMKRQQLQKQEELMSSLTDLVTSGKNIIHDSLALAKQQAAREEEVIKSVQISSEILIEAGYAFLARAFEEERLMSAEESNRITNEAIAKISSKSEKMGVLARSLNNSYIEMKNKRKYSK